MSKICPMCRENRSPLAYARAREVIIPLKNEYRNLDTRSTLQHVQMDWNVYVRRLFDIDRVMDWACTTPLTFVGYVGQQKQSPLRVYLNIADPTNQAHPRWDVYRCACDALKPFGSTSHTSGLTLYHNSVIRDGLVMMDAYHPLPAWAQSIMRYLELLPSNGKITRELFCSLLAGVPLNPSKQPLQRKATNRSASRGLVLEQLWEEEAPVNEKEVLLPSLLTRRKLTRNTKRNC